jgi:hypothetical protein
MTKRKKKWIDRLPGGLADRYTPDDFDPKALRQGIKVELEHTDDRTLATEIAMDHLVEDPNYYTKLATIETHPNTSKTKKTRTKKSKSVSSLIRRAMR